MLDRKDEMNNNDNDNDTNHEHVTLFGERYGTHTSLVVSSPLQSQCDDTKHDDDIEYEKPFLCEARSARTPASLCPSPTMTASHTGVYKRTRS